MRVIDLVHIGSLTGQAGPISGGLGDEGGLGKGHGPGAGANVGAGLDDGPDISGLGRLPRKNTTQTCVDLENRAGV